MENCVPCTALFTHSIEFFTSAPYLVARLVVIGFFPMLAKTLTRTNSIIYLVPTTSNHLFLINIVIFDM